MTQEPPPPDAHVADVVEADVLDFEAARERRLATPEDDADRPRSKRVLVATYDYYDEDGQLLYQVLRYQPKSFRQRRPDGNGKWIWKLDDVRRVLYRLDRILESDPDRRVYVVEGEKDVDALETRGLLATCNPHGAGQWSTVADCARVALRGRRVTIIADKDDPGRRHAAEVATHLRDIAAEVQIIESPIGKDAADWVAGGASADDIERAGAVAAPSPPLHEEFARDENGKIYHSQRNLKLALRKLGVTIRYNTFARRRIVDGLPGFGPKLDDDALNHLRLKIDAEFNFRLSKDFFYDVMVDHGHEHRFHPVREYLDSLTWDGVPRLDTWLSRYAGAEDTPYTRAIGTIVLVAAVRRVRQPGCKFDEMLILESDQGKSKSTALAVLAGDPDWFTDDLPLGEDTRKMIEQTTGRWIVEAGELKGMGKGDVAALKQYMGRTKDAARLAYGRETLEVARQFVIIGTCNPADGGYLKDTTGNRRFWPVRIQAFDIELLAAERDQLWAEAAAREAAGESIRLDPSLYEAAGEEQEQRRIEDPIELVIRRAFGDLTGRIFISDAWKVLGIQGRILSQDEMTRFGAAMRMHGWDRKRGRKGQELDYVYFKGNEVERKRWLTVKGTSVETL